MYIEGMRANLWVGAIGSLGFTATLCALASWAVRGAGPVGQYGLALFVAMPILHGMVAGLLAQWDGPKPWSVAAGAAWISLAGGWIGLLLFGLEGMVCIVMAIPLIVPLVFLGAWAGWRIRQPGGTARLSLPTVGMLLLAVQGGPIVPTPEASGEVVSVWHVAAPPERVWPHVLRLSSLPEPDWWLFRLGVAYPTQTETRADGQRTCTLSTGAMPEIVTARVEGKRLAFRVLSTPPTMKEWNPFYEVRPAHLTTTYRSRDGELRLYPERSGTRIVARSTYGLRMAPFGYWRLWSDAIVWHVHERVIREIARRATAD